MNGTDDLGGLRAAIAVRLGPLDLELDLRVAPGEVVALVGPNGAGKSTVLRCLAGLQAIDRGRIVLDATLLDDPDSATLVDAEARLVGMVFQDYLLFDHLDARQNVAFGLRARGATKVAARTTAEEWLQRFGLTAVADHRPRALSGGQQQRVALARALATGPRLLLLDEPLAALDATTRQEVRHELREHLAGFDGVAILVTHDPLDAYALADRVIVIEDGRATQAGTLAAIAARPRSRYVAQLVGTNLLTGQTAHGSFTSAPGAVLVVDAPFDGPAYAAIPPSAIALYRSPPDGSPRNVWPGRIAAIDLAFDRARVSLAEPLALVAELTPAGLAALDRHVGDEVWVAIKATEISTYPA